ncbi:hypothetical protein KJ840_00870 [Patescibacteria group bacterium]|nr:hypothetical protein [Patescibacteria group bacterium]
MPKNVNHNIKILSIGGRGVNILERLSAFDKMGIDRIAIGVNKKSFLSIRVKNKIELPAEKDTYEGNDIQSIAENVINEKRAEIEECLKGADTLFIIGNLANDISCYQIAQVAKIAKENDILTFFVGNTPFPFEGKSKIDLANKNKLFLEDRVDALLALESEKIMAEKIKAKEALTRVEKVLGEIITAIIDLIVKFGVINVDFADLKSTLQNSGEIFFNSVEGTKNDITTLIHDLFNKHDLVNKQKAFKKILYVIYAERGLLMDEVSFIGDKLQENFDKQARIIFGVVHEEKMKNKLKIVLLGV